METEHTSPGKIGLNYGIISGLILVVIQVILYVTGMALEGIQWPIYIYYVVFAVLIFLSINSFKKSNGGYLTISQALKTGVANAVISGLVYLVYNVLITYVIDPGYSVEIVDATRDKLAESGNLTDEQIEMTLSWLKYVTNPFIGGAIWIGISALLGLIYSLIGGAIMKNKNPHEQV